MPLNVIDHVGVSVVDLDRSIVYLTDPEGVGPEIFQPPRSELTVETAS